MVDEAGVEAVQDALLLRSAQTSCMNIRHNADTILSFTTVEGFLVLQTICKKETEKKSASKSHSGAWMRGQTSHVNAALARPAPLLALVVHAASASIKKHHRAQLWRASMSCLRAVQYHASQSKGGGDEKPL